MGYMEGRPLEPRSEPVKKVVPRPVPKPRRSIQQRRSSYLRSRSVELESSDGHNFSVYQRIDRPNMPVSTVSKSEEQQSPVTARSSRRKSRAEDLLPTRRSVSSAPTPSPRKNITPKFTPKAVEIEPGSRRMSRASSRSSSMCRIKTEPLLYNSQGHPNIQPRPKQPQHVYQGYNAQDVVRAEESLLNRSQSNSRKQRFSRFDLLYFRIKTSATLGQTRWIDSNHASRTRVILSISAQWATEHMVVVIHTVFTSRQVLRMPMRNKRTFAHGSRTVQLRLVSGWTSIQMASSRERTPETPLPMKTFITRDPLSSGRIKIGNSWLKVLQCKNTGVDWCVERIFNPTFTSVINWPG